MGIVAIETAEEMHTEFKSRYDACERMYGYFTANIDGNPVVCFIEHRTADDKPEGFWVAVAEGLFDEYLWDENQLCGYINRHTWAWTFHRPSRKGI